MARWYCRKPMEEPIANDVPPPLHYSDRFIASILNSVKTIAMVGASANIARPAYIVMKYLKSRGYHMIPVNPHYAGKEILGEIAYARLRRHSGADRHGRHLPAGGCGRRGGR